MSGVYICGAASIRTERVIVTGQTPASEEQVGGTAGGVSETGERHPAMATSTVTMTRTAGMNGRCWKLYWFFFDIRYLIFGDKSVTKHEIHPVILSAFPVKHCLIVPGLSFAYRTGKDGTGVPDRSGSGIHQIEMQLHRIIRHIPGIIDIPVHPFITPLTD
jgi:hypothetical protein